MAVYSWKAGTGACNMKMFWFNDLINPLLKDANIHNFLPYKQISVNDSYNAGQTAHYTLRMVVPLAKD